MNGSLAKPHRQNMIVVDVVTGLYGFQALSAALMRQFRFGEGSVMDVSLMQAAAAFQGAKIMEAHAEGPAPAPLYSPSGVFETSDSHILITAMRQQNFETLCEVLGCPQFGLDPKFSNQDLRVANRQEINAVLQSCLLQKTTDEWIDLLLAKGLMASKINAYADWLADEHVNQVRAFNMHSFAGFGELPVVEIPGCPSLTELEQLGDVPAIGEHSRAILDEIGWSQAKADELYQAGVLT